MCVLRQQLCWLYILLWHVGFWEAPGPTKRPRARAGDDKNIPGGLSHLGTLLGSLLNGCGAWLLVWGRRWFAAVLRVSAGALVATGALGDGKDSSGTSEVDDEVKDLGTQLDRE